MRRRRIMSMAMALCMLASMLAGIPAAAAEEYVWVYTLGFEVSNAKDSATGKNNVQCHMRFGKDYEVFNVQGVNKKGTETRTEYQSTRAPWTLDTITFENNHKDAVKIRSYYMWVRRSKKSAPEYGYNETLFQRNFPNGTGEKDGKWLDTDDHKQTRLIYVFWPERVIEKTGNFITDPATVYVSDSGSDSGTYELKYDGYVRDQYVRVVTDSPIGEKYYCLDLSAPPTITYAFSGQKKDGGTVNQKDLQTNAGFTFGDTGFTAAKNALAAYMNKNGVNRITVSATLGFPDGTVRTKKSPDKYTKEITFVRKAFEIESVSFSTNKYVPSTTDKKYNDDNNFYNNTIKNADGTRSITVTGTIKTGGNNDHLSAETNLSGAKLNFSEAYIALGDASKRLEARDKKLTIYGNTFKLTFPYDEKADSQNKSIELVLKGTLSPELFGGNTATLRDGAKVGYSCISSVNKVDAVSPNLRLTAAEGSAEEYLSKWHKTADLTVTPTETIYSALGSGETTTEGYAVMELKNGSSNVAIYDYKGKNSPSATQKVPATKGSDTGITLRLRDAVEGSFTLVFSGKDAAGNPLSKKLENVLLDNKAPEVTVDEQCGLRKQDGSRSNSYSVKITDASKTGRLYYCFTDSLVNVPEFDENAAQKQTSGEIDSTLNKWAFIDQADTENGNTASAIIRVEKGKNFKGRLIYFARDGFGNATDQSVRDINIDNEDTACRIETESDSSVPHRNYKITVSTNSNNKVEYLWKDSKNNPITKYEKYTGGINTADNAATSALNGAYTLVCKIIPPSGEKSASYTEKTFSFDNEGPAISVRSLTPDTCKAFQTVSVFVTDASGVTEGFASVVNPDGTPVEGFEEFALATADGAISQNINIGSIPNGAYALKVRAADKNGIETSAVSESFGIRCEKPEITASIVTGKQYNEKALTASSDITVSVKASESFKNAAQMKNQAIYCRIGESLSTLGDWVKIGDAAANGDIITAELNTKAPVSSLPDGRNVLYIQAAVFDADGNTSKINAETVWSGELEFYHDETAPQSRLVIEDKHTAESISGKVYLSDNLDSELTLTSDSSAIKIEKAENERNVFSITVTENVDNAKLRAMDAAGNTSEIPVTIKGIDREAPTADISISHTAAGARTDAQAALTVNGVKGDGVLITAVSEEDYKTYISNGKIDGKLFEKSTDDNITIMQTREEEGLWDGEKNLTYSVRAAGLTGNYFICIRAEDSVGNTADIISSEPLSPKDAELTHEFTINPMKAGKKSIVKVKFNMPVYVLPQDKIRTKADDTLIDTAGLTETEKITETNLALAKSLGGFYSQDYSFTIEKNGEYMLYTADDIGRTKLVRLTAEGVEFNSTGGLKAEIYDGETLITDFSLVNPAGYPSPKLVITPEKAGKNLAPLPSLDKPQNGLEFSEEESEHGASDSTYTKLVYTIVPIEDENYQLEKSTERLIEAYIFDETNTEPSTWSLESLVLDGIDNTPPETSVRVTPEIFVFGDDDYGHPERIVPTAGEVVFYVTAQDAESGIGKIKLLSEYNDETQSEIVVEAPLDEDHSEEPWSWDGAQYNIPVKIDYYGDTDPKSVKMMRYTFSDNHRIRAVEVENKSGNRSWAMLNFMEGLGTMGAICKLELEENKDYKLKYYYLNSNDEWIEIPDPTDEKTFYKKAKVVLEPMTDYGDDQTRWEIGDREIRVLNNNGLFEKELDSFERSFTFKIKDKFGYTKDVRADALDNFDCEPGEISYTLSETGKTNKDIRLTVTAADEKSGVGKVMLVSAKGSVELTENDGAYEYDITENGVYSIVMLDGVGNKTSKNFSVGNIDKTVPTAEVEYSTDKVTSRPVSASLTFSKPNVRITRIEYNPSGTLRASDYSVNYTTSVITFTKTGTVDVYFEDEFGNEGVRDVTVANIDTTPPALEAVMTPNPNKTEVSVRFDKAKNSETGEAIDKRRELGDVTVAYGGIARKADTAEFVFCENGFYTFKTYDDEGTSAFLTVEIKDIDTKAPVITQVRWSYEYDVLENGAWQTKTHNGSVTPSKAGYIIASDANPVTNQDVTVTVVTDDETRNAGSSGEFAKENEKVYSDNGLYIFNMEKSNLLTDSYGVDVEIIDRVPPVIDLFGKNELVFYENSSIGEAYNRDMLEKPGVAFKAFDAFGKGTDLNGAVSIDWGGFDPSDINKNTFDSGKPYTITYSVSDKAHNITEVKRTVRLVGMHDTVAFVNGNLPDASGRCEVEGDKVTVSLKNISPSAAVYVRRMSGLKTMGQMKKSETVVPRDENGSFTVTGLSEGWHTFYVQTDKRDYFVLQVYIYI